jgi:hypothetical protein
MHDIYSCKEALKKAQRIDVDDEGLSNSSIVGKILEEKLLELQ